MSTSVVPGRAPASTSVATASSASSSVEHRDADVGAGQRLGRRRRAPSRRAPPAARRASASGSRPRADSRRRGCARRSGRPSSRARRRRRASRSLQHPSRRRPRGSGRSRRRSRAGRATRGRSRPSSPSGRSAFAPRSARRPPACSDHSGESPTMPGWIALTRIGASWSASVRTRPVTPPFTVVTVVEPGYGRRSAWPPKSRIEASSVSRGTSACTTSVYPTSLSVTSRIARAMSYSCTVFWSRSIAASTRWSTAPTCSSADAMRSGSARSSAIGVTSPGPSIPAASSAQRLISRPVMTTSRTACGVRLREPEPDAGGATDDDDGSACHGRQR